MTRPRTVVLTDGEHYPAVTHDAILELGVDRDIVAAVFIGGPRRSAQMRIWRSWECR